MSCDMTSSVLLIIPKYSVQLKANLIKVTDTPAISNEVIKLPMYALTTFTFLTSTVR